MSAIREEIMARKVRLSLTTCWFCWKRQAWQGRKKRVPCTRLTLFIKGRYYQHWICLGCQRRIWGTVCSQVRVKRRLPGFWSAERAQVKW